MGIDIPTFGFPLWMILIDLTPFIPLAWPTYLPKRDQGPDDHPWTRFFHPCWKADLLQARRMAAKPKFFNMEDLGTGSHRCCGGSGYSTTPSLPTVIKHG